MDIRSAAAGGVALGLVVVIWQLISAGAGLLGQGFGGVIGTMVTGIIVSALGAMGLRQR